MAPDSRERRPGPGLPPERALLAARLAALGWQIVIQSSRARYPGGREAIKGWLLQHGFPAFPVVSEKPPAELYIDDRGLRFDGSVASMLDAIEGWRGPWHKQAQERQ